MNQREIQVLQRRLIPTPRDLQFRDGEYYRLVNDCRISASNPEVVKKLARAYWDIQPKVEPGSVPAEPAGEAYTINITADHLTITGNARLAMQTLRQLAEVERQVEKFTYHFLVQAEIADTPAMPFRGIHLCWFPETTVWQIEKQIRLAAYYKFNYIVLEPWGVFPFESHPELCWDHTQPTRDDFRRLVELAKELGLELIPQFNLLGHGSAARVSSGKHAFLDRNPALQSLQEPDGWTWCLSNPVTRQFLTDMVLELHDFFGSPSYFHIGCDEAYNLASCAACRKSNLHDLVKEHILYFHDLLAQRHCRTIMWHDMLLNRDDPRWTDCIVCGHSENGLGSLYQSLPRDIVIADWQYGYPKKDDCEPAWQTTRFFKQEGFPVVVCPWLQMEGTLSLGQLAKDEQLLGMLETTWHLNYGHNLHRIYLAAASGSWSGKGNFADFNATCSQLNFHLRQICSDMGLIGYEQTGTSVLQVLEPNYPN